MSLRAAFYALVALGIMLPLSKLSMAQTTENVMNRAEIGNGSFSHSVGVVTVNQASGLGNTQTNQVGIVIGTVTEMTSDSLSRVAIAGQGGGALAAGKASRNVTQISDGAFQGSRGIVQVNQVAGFGNSTGNSFGLGVSVGGP